MPNPQNWLKWKMVIGGKSFNTARRVNVEHRLAWFQEFCFYAKNSGIVKNIHTRIVWRMKASFVLTNHYGEKAHWCVVHEIVLKNWRIVVLRSRAIHYTNTNRCMVRNDLQCTQIHVRQTCKVHPTFGILSVNGAIYIRDHQYNPDQ
jgi:hypothetical protein